MTQKIAITAATMVTLTLSPAIAYSSEPQNYDWFITAKVGKATVADSYDEINYNAARLEFSHDNNYSLSVGYALNSFHLEGEYSTRRFNAERWICPSCGSPSTQAINLEGYQQQQSLLIMGYWFPMKDERLKPFLGVGVGYTEVSWKNVRFETLPDGFNGTDTVFTYKFTAGVERPLSENTAFILSYSLLRPDNVEIKDSDGNAGKLNNQQINIIDIGFKYHF